MAAPVCYLRCSVSAFPFSHSLSRYEMKKHLSINRESKQIINVCKKLWKSALGKSSSIKAVILPNKQSKRHSPHKTSEWPLKGSQQATWTATNQSSPELPLSAPLFIKTFHLHSVPKMFLLFLSWSLPRHQKLISTSVQWSKYATNVLAARPELLSKPVHSPDRAKALVWQLPQRYSVRGCLSAPSDQRSFKAGEVKSSVVDTIFLSHKDKKLDPLWVVIS